MNSYVNANIIRRPQREIAPSRISSWENNVPFQDQLIKMTRRAGSQGNLERERPAYETAPCASITCSGCVWAKPEGPDGSPEERRTRRSNQLVIVGEEERGDKRHWQRQPRWFIAGIIPLDPRLDFTLRLVRS